MPRAAASMSMKLRVNRKVQANLVLPSFRFVYHCAVPCHVRLCKTTESQRAQGVIITAAQPTNQPNTETFKSVAA